ncbi:MAG: FHA domain-containing protein [Deltaproteobacteria bacterium]|nr:FHA domain-containing protein [Deltaproteobacteria bacterium]
MPKLIVSKSGEQEEKVLQLGAEATLGRRPENDLHLAGSGVSREHARVIQEGEQYYLIDLESGNGTLLNGLMIRPNEKNLLRNNDRITIENFHVRFFETDENFEKSLSEEEEVTDADILEVKLLKKILDAVDQETIPTLEVLNGNAQGKRFFLADDVTELILGREEGCDFCIDEYVISRQHAKIIKKWGGIALVDLDSKNGTFVNNKRITEEFLHDGDRIALGTIVLLFRNPKEINVKAISEEMVRARPVIRPKESPEEILKGLPSLRPAAANVYPSPRQALSRFNAMELGMIGLGIIIFAFAAITLVNLILE